MTEISLRVIALATAVTATVACSSSDDSSSGSSSADSATADAAADSGAADATQLSPVCQRLYDCCVGPAAQTPQFCTGLAAEGICDTWLQSYAQAGIKCS